MTEGKTSGPERDRCSTGRELPGEFQALAGLYIDRNNRMFTSEQYPGRVQMFRYFTDDEAREQIKQRQTETDKKKAQGTKPAAADAAASALKTDSAAKPQ